MSSPHYARRPSSASSVSSASSWASIESPPTSRRASLRFLFNAPSPQLCNAPMSSRRSCEGMSVQQTRHLWRCMLKLQRRYACYNSTRIDLAVNAGNAGVELMPTPFIIDTLNDSLVDLPDEGWQMLDRCLQPRKAIGKT